MPVVGHVERVSVIEVGERFVTVRLIDAGHSQGDGRPFRQVFRSYVDRALRAELRAGQEALLVYDKIPHGIGYWLRPLPANAPQIEERPITAITAADVMARALKRERN